MWLTSLVYATAITLAVCIPAWPGQMTYDPLFAWKESIHGIEILTWPPAHAYLFWLSRNLGAGAGGLFAAQTFLIFFSAGIIASLLIARRALVWAALLLFAALFVIVPPMLGVMLSQWRDVTTGATALAAVAAWLLAARYRSRGFIVVMAAMVCLCMALRYNAFPLFGLLAPMMVWRPFLTPGASAGLRVFTAVALIVGVGLAAASMFWRLPDFKSPPRANTVAAIQLFDLIGVSACTGVNYLPPALTGGEPLSTEQLRQVYDPRHINRAFRQIPGVPRLREADVNRETQETWLKVVPREFDCYLIHKTAVFIEQMGIAKDAVFYPAHGRIDPNPYGLRIAHPEWNRAVTEYVRTRSPSPWRRPAWLYLGAALVTVGLALRRNRWTLLALATLAGAYGNVALLFLIDPAGDARYIFPSNVMCAVLIAAGLGLLLEGRERRRA